MYAIGLARELGMSVRELLATHTSAEISEQMAYDRLRRQLEDEGEQRRALDQAVHDGLHSIKKQVKR